VTLSVEQRDALTELVNIAFSRTAAALSEITANRVELSVPEVASVPVQELKQTLGRFVREEVATIHQIFGGPVSGDAFLMFDLEGAAKLVMLLSDSHAPTRQMGASDREVLAEVGNILLNACLGVFGDLLEVRFTFAVPRLQVESLGSMLASLLIERNEIRHGLVVGTRFAIRESDVMGCMVLVLGVTSLEKFMAAVDSWAERSVAGDEDGR
jgi:chemotaxis protein CheC